MDMNVSPTISYDAGNENRTTPRVWPAVALVAVFWVWRAYLAIGDLSLLHIFLGMMAGTALLMLVFLVWWSLDRRGRRGERLVPILAFIAFAVIAGFISRNTLGPMTLFMAGVPWAITAWAAWAVVSRSAEPKRRRAGLLIVLALTWGVVSLLRMEGLSGQGGKQLAWRWSPTPEERYMAERTRTAGGKASTQLSTTSPTEVSADDWLEFRGPGRDGVVRGVRIGTDWNTNPPKLVWRDRVGPGWSSIIVVGGRLYTQEQRGQSEAVVCRDAATGRELWAHEDAAVRFNEAVSGAGPRATPTYANGRVYTMGGTGLLNCLDAASGERKWSRDAAAESGAKPPIWGFAGSPLITRGGLALVFTGGDGSKSLLAYNADTGQPAWQAAAGKISYSSPHLASIAGEEQVLMWSDRGLTAFDPATGKKLWEGATDGSASATRCIQPHVVGSSQVIVGSEGDFGVSLIDVKRDGSTCTAEQRWRSPQFRGMFNDLVVAGGHVYGLDGGAVGCVGLNDGKRRWRKGRYGAGQMLLLADQSLLLITCESGEVALVAAKPDGHHELGRFEAITGKTWNHPTIARGKLYVRNGEEIACFELPAAQN